MGGGEQGKGHMQSGHNQKIDRLVAMMLSCMITERAGAAGRG